MSYFLHTHIIYRRLKEVCHQRRKRFVSNKLIMLCSHMFTVTLNFTAVKEIPTIEPSKIIARIVASLTIHLMADSTEI